MAQTAVGVLVIRNETLLFSDALARAIEVEPSVHLLSEPVPLREGLELCRQEHPQVVLLEASEMSEGSMRGSVRSLVRACDGAPVILLADSEIDDSFLVAGVEAGASGIVDGKAGVEEVVGAVRAAAAGHRVVDPDRFISAVEGTARAREVMRDEADRTGQLTDRERDVLTCLARAMSNADIADRLSISPRTVDKHVQHILQKLGVKSRLAAAILASRMRDPANDEMRGTA
jgi:NarL family two-component system response regulator LiaR